jgi:hypothetical protein
VDVGARRPQELARARGVVTKCPGLRYMRFELGLMTLRISGALKLDPGGLDDSTGG